MKPNRKRSASPFPLMIESHMCCIRRIKQALVVLLFLCTPDLVLGRKAAEANGALRNADFDLTPEWVMSIQNGPAVLRLRYKYNGANAVRIKTRRDGGQTIEVTFPEYWRRFNSMQAWSGPLKATRLLQPGDEWDEYFYAHHHFDNIRAGTQSMRALWNVELADEDLSRPVRILRELQLSVAQATPERFEEMYLLQLSQLMKPDLSRQALKQLIATCTGCRDKQMLSVVFAATTHKFFDEEIRKLAVSRFLPPTHDTFATDTVSRVAEVQPAVDAMLSYLKSSEPEHVSLIHEILLSDSIVADCFVRKAALAAPDVSGFWAKCVIFLHCSDSVRYSWSMQFLDQASSIAASPDRREVNELLNQLDSASFRTREFASKRLAKLGQPVLPHIREALDGMPSSESVKRLDRLLSDIPPEGQPPIKDAERFIYLITNWKPKSAQKLLIAMSKNPSNSWLAREALQGLSSRPENK